LPNISEHFAHVLLFACPECARPLVSACASSKRNLEVGTAQAGDRTRDGKLHSA
jgi:hypothetical protein